jgi:hypothetical protein
MKIWLRRLLWLLILAIAATIVWDQRDRIAVLSNNSFLIQGDWHPVEMGFKGDDLYEISERIITKNGLEWGSYELRTNTRLEVMTRGTVATYRLEFPDEDTMVWWREVDGKEVPAYRWKR